MATGRVPTTANSPLTAKGDLFGYSTTQARVAVGNNGETLVADSSTSTGLRYQGNFAAGKNKIINGDFRINQRSFSSSTGSDFVFDRWLSAVNGGTVTSSAETFTVGTAPVTGYEAINFYRIATTGQSAVGNFALINTRLEDVRIFANETITVSFWAKANSGTPKVAIDVRQVFGGGGSASVSTYGGQVTLSTSWARYSVTVLIPSISGKTIGTSSYLQMLYWVSAGSDFNDRTGSLGIQTNTFDFWGMQVEAGSVATAFQTATGTLQGELAACQRYYQRTTVQNVNGRMSLPTPAITASACYIIIQHAVQMRAAVTSIDYSSVIVGGDLSGTITPESITLNAGGVNITTIQAQATNAYTQYRSYFLLANNTTSAYIGYSAEL